LFIMAEFSKITAGVHRSNFQFDFYFSLSLGAKRSKIFKLHSSPSHAENVNL
jgi:hypothetical protein